MPKITNVLNEGRRLRAHDGDKEFTEFCEKQLSFLRKEYGKDQDAVLELYALLVKAVQKVL